MNFSLFDFDFSSMSDFEAAEKPETQFKLEPIDLVKNAVSSALTQYQLLCSLTF